MPRARCIQCDYPKKVCVCAAVKPVNIEMNIDILQHPTEVHVAKNTGRLVKLCISHTTIHVGEVVSDFSALRATLNTLSPAQVALVYPLQKNTPAPSNIDLAQVKYLLFIDATWRKAHKMMQLNPWLAQYPRLGLKTNSLRFKPNYEIRFTKKTDALSTLEAVAAALITVDPNCDVTPLFDVFDKMKQPYLAAIKDKTA